MERNHIDLPILIAQTGPLNGQRWTINDALVIGRDGSCEIVVQDRQVSRYHARLMPSSEGVILEDLDSKNGTFVNGQRINESMVMQDGDLIQIALAQHFVYLSSDATMPLDTNIASSEEPVYSLHMDNRSRRVWVKRQELIPPLSVQQFRLLHVLFEHRDQVVSRQELVESIWGDEQGEGVSEQAIDALVRRLRDRLAALDSEHAYILTVRGHGLRLDNPEETPEL
ncbi:MAG TPA: FHA domain-containing protein [Anaerolineaceae bacterium]|jgi:DNA-binding winged helix-turn-helix (wHTH) protein